MFSYEKSVKTTDINQDTTINIEVLHFYPTSLMRLSQYILEAAHSCHILQDSQESFDSNVS